MGKNEIGSLCFTVEGEFLTQHFRARWVDGYDPQVPILFMQSMIGMNVEHASAILSGKKKLIGDSTIGIDMVDDDADECEGIELLSLDDAAKHRGMLSNLAKVCDKFLRSWIDVADLNSGNKCGFTTYTSYMDHMENYVGRLKVPRDIARMVRDKGSRSFWSFISQLVKQSYSEIKRVTQDAEYDYVREYEQEMTAAFDNIEAQERTRAAIRESAVEESRPVSTVDALNNDAMSALVMAGVPNAAKYQKAMNDKLAGKGVDKLVKAVRGGYAKVEFGFLTPAGELYLCGFFEHNDLQGLLIDAGLWVDHQMVSLKQGPGAAKMWYKEDCDSWDLPKEERSKLYKKPTKEQELTILQWCEENKVSFNDCAMHLFDY